MQDTTNELIDQLLKILTVVIRGTGTSPLKFIVILA